MSRSTISTFQLFEMYPDEESARIYLEGRIWPSGPVSVRKRRLLISAAPKRGSSPLSSRAERGARHGNQRAHAGNVRPGQFYRADISAHGLNLPQGVPAVSVAAPPPLKIAP
jgi:hypothetical protein